MANQKCPKTNLYPYQLAAVQYTDSNTPDDEAPDWSDGEKGADEEYSDIADEEDNEVAKLQGPNLLLRRIYELLRQTPNLVGDGISPDRHLLSHPELIASAREELELAYLCDPHLHVERECAAQHRQTERERAAKMIERKRKHRSSSQTTRKSSKSCSDALQMVHL